MPLALEPGRVVDDRYQIVRPIGRGGMGVVFEARHLRLNSRVALKFVRDDPDSRPTLNETLSVEGRFLGTLEHENIARVLDKGEDLHRQYLALEFIEGTSLKELVEDGGPLEPLRAIEIVSQVCRGLTAAHALGIVHRDLKPSNIMLTQHADGSDLVKVLDFGAAREVIAAGDTSPTSTGCPGTAAYQAPEVARGTNRGDVLTDIYSLGVVLYELLSGRRPHEGQSQNAVLFSVATGGGVPLSRICPGLAPEILRVVQSCLDADRQLRPQSAHALLSLLEDCLANLRAGPLYSRSAVRRESPVAPRVWIGLAAVAMTLSLGVVLARVVDQPLTVTRAMPVASEGKPTFARAEVLSDDPGRLNKLPIAQVDSKVGSLQEATSTEPKETYGGAQSRRLASKRAPPGQSVEIERSGAIVPTSGKEAESNSTANATNPTRDNVSVVVKPTPSELRLVEENPYK